MTADDLSLPTGRSVDPVCISCGEADFVRRRWELECVLGLIKICRLVYRFVVCVLLIDFLANVFVLRFRWYWAGVWCPWAATPAPAWHCSERLKAADAVAADADGGCPPGGPVGGA